MIANKSDRLFSITRDPDLVGSDGITKAWLMTTDKTSPNFMKDWKASIAQYILQVPWAHPAWSWYHVSAVHLRDIEGVPSAKKHFPEAQYEFQIMSLDPRNEVNIEKLEHHEDSLHFLTPPDLIHQVSGITDEQCKTLVQDMVVAIIEHRMSPDVDYRRQWQISIDATVEHYKKGLHKPV